MGNSPQFDPRLAALNHAGRSTIDASTERGDNDSVLVTVGLTDLASSIACGLVYVGDQLAAANEQREVTNNHLSAIANLLQTLDATVNDRLLGIEETL